MKTIEVAGMKRPVCASCFEYPENCVGCEWHECSICGEELADSETYEYRGAFACAKHHEESIRQRDVQRQEVMAETEHAVRSQADSEWQNGGYKTMKTDAGGRPITMVKEPERLKVYEGRS